MDREEAESACRRLYEDFDSFSFARRNALIDFVLDVNEGGAQECICTNAAIDLGLWKTAAHCLEDSMWFRQADNDRAKRIVEAIREG